MFFVQMKKNLLIIFSFVAIFLVGCSNSGEQITKIDLQERISKNWVSVEDSFSKQLDGAQYIMDLERFLSYDILSITEDIPFVSDFSFSAKFDEKSPIQWWMDFSWKEMVKSKDLESIDIDLDITTKEQGEDLTPFDLSWSVTLLYKDNEVYANLHDLWVFMWEWNMAAKMYTLLWDLLVDNWVNLEVHSWGVITINDEENKKLPYIVWTIKNVFKTENIQSTPNFIWSVAELIDVINLYIDLGISTDELSILDQEISYFEMSDKTIQKQFTWFFQWRESAFDMSFVVSKKWFNLRLYNIREYDEENLNYKDTEQEILFTILEDKNSEYFVSFESLKAQQKVVVLNWKIECGDIVHFLVDFVLEPLQIIAWQKISWKIDGAIVKKAREWGIVIPELSGNVLLRSDLISSL